jgi:anaerobic magnesium-protoporphyrin IX monomethyl ester cyclase
MDQKEQRLTMISVSEKQREEIFLIVPPSPTLYARILTPWISASSPLGIGYITAMLQKDGFNVLPLNLYLGLEDLKMFEALIIQKKPTIIGFSTMTENFQNGIRLAKIIRDVNPDTIIIFGGPHVSVLVEETLYNNDCVDIIVRGEGEYTMVELANYFIRNRGALDDIKGIAYKSHGTIVRTAVRPLIKDLDVLPFPYRDITDIDGLLTKEKIFAANKVFITSRGCPGRCKFCAAAALAGGKYRMRSIENIAYEISEAKHTYKDLNYIFFGDDTISADLSRLLKLCKFLKKENVLWSAESRVDAMTEDLAAALVNSGCVGVQFGIESGSQELLDRMGKNITLDQIHQALKWTSRAGLGVVCSMMIGLPDDTIETINQTLDFAEKLQKEYNKVAVVLACTVAYPGTYYFKHAKDLGLFISTRNYDSYSTVMPIMDTPYLTRWQIRNAYFEAYRRLARSMSEECRQWFRSVANRFSYKNAVEKISSTRLLQKEK